MQAGADFKGVFHQFTAAVDFDPAALATAHIEVTIDMNSVDSGDKDRDGTMRGADIFDVGPFPDRALRDTQLDPHGHGFQRGRRAHPARRHQGRAHRVQVRPGAAGATLSGTAELKRLDFGVGRGDWKSTEWVADAVKVAFSLNLKPKT